MGVESKTSHPIVFLDFHIHGDEVGRVVLELDTQSAPRTCENFRSLCTGEHGTGEAGYPLYFKGSPIHKIVPNILLQGGDITNYDGTGGDTIYGRVYTEDINPNGLKFDEGGILGLANSVDRREDNTSQFFITVDACPHLEGANIAFGKVLKGLDVVRELCNQQHVNNVPVEKIEIGDCGEIKPGQDWGYAENDGTTDIYPPFPENWELPSSSDVAEQVYQAVRNIKDSGNSFYRAKKFSRATRKYEKAIRYLEWAKKLNKSSKVDRDQYTTCLLNLGATKLELKQYSEARKLCSAVLLQNPNSAKASKAFFRRGKAHFALNEYDAALKDLKKAFELDPDPYIQAEITKVDGAIKEYLQEEKRTYAAMLK